MIINILNIYLCTIQNKASLKCIQLLLLLDCQGISNNSDEEDFTRRDWIIQLFEKAYIKMTLQHWKLFHTLIMSNLKEFLIQCEHASVHLIIRSRTCYGRIVIWSMEFNQVEWHIMTTIQYIRSMLCLIIYWVS